MRITSVSLRPTEASDAAGRPALTPELLAASGARYSRSNDGLDAILSKIDPNNLDKSVDSIFRMIDYGHQSIADMAPVAMFMDDMSLWLAYHVWTLCATAGGQESSTRYIRLEADGLVAPEELGIADEDKSEWLGLMEESFAAYREALGFWEAIAEENPDVTRIPRSLLEDSSPKALRTVERMRRNYAFDRARYWLPVAARTNVMLIMSARAWVTLCQHLLSHPLAEANALGAGIARELEFSAPRMLKHATEKPSYRDGIAREFAALAARARATKIEILENADADADGPSAAHLEIMLPVGATEDDLRCDLSHHDNRYSWIGETLKRTAVRFWWDGITLAEIRDLNRHRTGTKHCPLMPLGFYSAIDQLSESIDRREARLANLKRLAEVGKRMSRRGLDLLRADDPRYIYWTPLGTQYYFEHTTTADKFIYEAELRTGTGAHYRYARHLHDALELWYERFPTTRELILEGSAEPE